MQLSICIITKNEQQNIARCLQCLTPYDFEVVVVDTGSMDRTREIARTYTEDVYDFAWCDDFAAAKNYAISKATNPYVMILDSDEFVEHIDMPKLERFLAQNPCAVGRIQRRNTFSRRGQQQENREWINRIFAKDKFRYEGRIHEQVTAADGSAYDTYQAPVVIEHTGYDLPEKARKEKAQRNIRLLKQELDRLYGELSQKQVNRNANCVLADARTDAGVQDCGQTTESTSDGGQVPYILYQLGKSYYMSEDYTTACDYFSQGLSYDLNPKLEYVIDMVETYGYALINSGQAESALFFENIYDEFGDCADFKFLMGLIYMNNARFEEAVTEFLKATRYKECRNQGANSYSAYYNIGVIYECIGNVGDARSYYEKCGEYEPAVKRLGSL